MALEPKLASRQLPQDLNWDLRVGEMYAQLVQRDPLLPASVIEHAEFGRPGHILFTQGAGPALQAKAADRVLDYLQSHPDTAWTSDVIALLASSSQPHHRNRVRAVQRRLAAGRDHPGPVVLPRRARSRSIMCRV